MKKILIISGLLLGAAAVWGRKKLTNAKYAFDNMTIEQYGYPKDIELIDVLGANGRVKFKTAVQLKNHSLQDFHLDGGVVASLSKLAFIYNGQTIGYANVNISMISVPAVGQTIIENIPVEIPTANILNNLANIPDMIAKFSIIGYVDVLGTEYLIGS